MNDTERTAAIISLTVLDPAERDDVERQVIKAIEAAVASEREHCALIADEHYLKHRGDSSGMIHQGQCHQAIAVAIRNQGRGEKP